MRHDLTLLLRKAGVPLDTARSVAGTVTNQMQARMRTLRKNDWDYLKKPLRMQIRTLSSGRSVWSKTPRCELYDMYLSVLRKTLKRICAAEDHARLRGLTIPQTAAAKDAARDGMAWSDWTPRVVYDATLLEFEKHNALHQGKGKRIVPFATRFERSASDVRWDKLLTRMLTDIASHLQCESGNYVLIDAMQQAREAIVLREPDAVCPVDWRHLLPKDMQADLEEWLTITHNGMRAVPPSHPQYGRLMQKNLAAQGRVLARNDDALNMVAEHS